MPTGKKQTEKLRIQRDKQSRNMRPWLIVASGRSCSPHSGHHRFPGWGPTM